MDVRAVAAVQRAWGKAAYGAAHNDMDAMRTATAYLDGAALMADEPEAQILLAWAAEALWEWRLQREYPVGSAVHWAAIGVVRDQAPPRLEEAA